MQNHQQRGRKKKHCSPSDTLPRLVYNAATFCLCMLGCLLLSLFNTTASELTSNFEPIEEKNQQLSTEEILQDGVLEASSFRQQPGLQVEETAAKLVFVFLAMEIGQTVALFMVENNDKENGARWRVPTTTRREHESERGAAQRALTADTSLKGPPAIEFLQQVSKQYTSGDSTGKCGFHSRCAIWCALVQFSPLRGEEVKRGLASRGSFISLNDLKSDPSVLPSYLIAGLPLVEKFLDPWVRTAGIKGQNGCNDKVV